MIPGDRPISERYTAYATGAPDRRSGDIALGLGGTFSNVGCRGVAALGRA
jgi:hypothetical protein